MTFLLFLGIIVMVIGLNRTISELPKSDKPIQINIPTKTRLLSIDVDDGKMYATTEGANHTTEIFIFSATDGKPLGKIIISRDP